MILLKVSKAFEFHFFLMAIAKISAVTSARNDFARAQFHNDFMKISAR